VKGTIYTLEEIAHVCHEVNRVMQTIQGDPAPSPPWDDASDLVKDTLINAVRMIRMNYSSEEMHQEWLDRYTGQGWKWGPEKNSALRTHPCLIPYHELPDLQRHKTEMIRINVIRMSSF
jgi:hypothetical protein